MLSQQPIGRLGDLSKQAWHVPRPKKSPKVLQVPEKKVVADKNLARYRGKPRLGTMVELLRVVDYLRRRLCDVSLPFIVLHGNTDAVTGPSASQALYETVKSTEKTIKMYDGMMHSLLFGETDEYITLMGDSRPVLIGYSLVWTVEFVS